MHGCEERSGVNNISLCSRFKDSCNAPVHVLRLKHTCRMALQAASPPSMMGSQPKRSRKPSRMCRISGYPARRVVPAFTASFSCSVPILQAQKHVFLPAHLAGGAHAVLCNAALCMHASMRAGAQHQHVAGYDATMQMHVAAYLRIHRRVVMETSWAAQHGEPPQVQRCQERRQKQCDFARKNTHFQSDSGEHPEAR